MVDRSNEIIEILGNIHFFDLLNEEELVSVSEGLNTVFFKQDEIIFEEGLPADGIYIVLSGRVSIIRESDQDVEELLICQKGDYFGEEGMSPNTIREVSAYAATNVIAIHINEEHWQFLLDSYPQIIPAIQLASASYALFLDHPFSWLAPREAVHFIARVHKFRLWLDLLFPATIGSASIILFLVFYINRAESGIPLSLIFAILSIAAFIWFIWRLVDWSNDFAIVTNRRVIALEKVLFFYESRQEAPLDAILAMDTSSSLIGRWLGFGDIVIRTFTGEIRFKNLGNPELIVRLINDERKRAAYQSNKLQRVNKEDIIRSRLGYENRPAGQYEERYPQADEKPNAEKEQEREVVSSHFMESLSSIFSLRSEENGIITYRTHWWFLLRKIFLPSVALLANLLIFVFFFDSINSSANFIAIVLIQFVITLVFMVWWAYQFQDWRNDRYIITEEQLIDLYKKPLGSEQKRSAPIMNIQTVEFERLGLISLILNFGTVFIRVGETTLTFDYVYKPSSVQKEIFEHYQNYKQRQAKKERDNLQNEVAEWIEVYHDIVKNRSKSDNSSADQDETGYNIADR